MPVSETPNTATSFDEAAVRAVVRTLRSYGPLPRHTIASLVGESRWRETTVLHALHAAVDRDLVRPLGGGFYEAR
jgi:hypothetical protein